MIEDQGNANDKIVTGLYEDVESLTVSVVWHVFWEIEKETVDKKVTVTKKSWICEYRIWIWCFHAFLIDHSTCQERDLCRGITTI